MATRAGLRTLIRTELNDSGGTPLWTNGQLDEWLVEAIREYSRALPKEASESLTTVAEQADYSLAADCLLVRRVEHPEGFFRIADFLAGGDLIDPYLLAQGQPVAVATQLSYEVWGPVGSRTLTLRPAPTASGESIAVRYYAAWAEPSADGDEIALPNTEEHLLIWLVASSALQWIGTDEAKRQRFERQRGVSAASALGAYEREWRRAVAERRARVTPRRLMARE
jgi:hypothetical protein